MTADTDIGAASVRHSPALVVESQRDVAQPRAAADANLIVVGVDGDVGQIGHVDHEGTVLAAETSGGIGVATTSSTDGDVLLGGSLDGGGDLLWCGGVGQTNGLVVVSLVVGFRRVCVA